MITIRKGKLAELDAMMSIYDKARAYMRENGNMTQWNNGYPSRSIVENDIESGVNYVGVDESGEIVMTFAFITGEDPTYSLIEDGAWLDEQPYATIHRLASSGRHKGIFRRCIEFCNSRINNIRLDTHADNRTMQNAAISLGFRRCGIIYCSDGTPRIAYQRNQEPDK